MAKKLPKEPQVREDEEVATTTSSTSSTNSQLPSWKDKPNAREADDSTYNAYANALSTAQNSNTATTLPPTTSETATKQSILQTPSVREDEKQAEQIAYNNALSSPTTSENATKTDILQKPITMEDDITENSQKSSAEAPSHETTEETPAAQTDNPIVGGIEEKIDQNGERENQNSEGEDTSNEQQSDNVANEEAPTYATYYNAMSNENDYYNKLKSQSYRAMLDSEIQASAARDQATKYLNASLAANGFANQGLAESSRLGVQNSYMQALANAQSTNANNQLNIAQQQYEAQQQTANDNFQSLATIMSNASDKETLDSILTNYGIEVDSSGNLGGKGFESLDNNSKNQLNALYKIYSNELTSTGSLASKFSGQEGYSNANSLKEIKVGDGKHTVNGEIGYITSNATFLSSLTNGKAVMLQHATDSNYNLYLQFYNGKWYQISANDYWNADNKELVKGK